MKVDVDPANKNNLGFTNARPINGQYTATIYVQGQPFQVQIDSGSPDLWVKVNSTNLPAYYGTGYNSSESYAGGTHVDSQIMLANVSLGEFTVEGQAFLPVLDAGDSLDDGYSDGILGVGPFLSSPILLTLYNTSYRVNGFPLIFNVFANYPDEQSFITIFLTREDFGITQGGFLGISEIMAENASIIEAPKLPLFSNSSWSTLMDGIYVNGEFLTGHSFGTNYSGFSVQPGVNQTVIEPDSGTTLISAPPYYVDAVYKGIPGAIFDEDQKTYQVPCETKLNVSMVFGETEYPMNPLDVIYPSFSNESAVCYGSMFYGRNDTGVDFYLGDSFMMNVYTLFNYGYWIDPKRGAPYIQMLSLTDRDQAWADFDFKNLIRLGNFAEQQIQQNENITSSYVTAAAMITTYPVVSAFPSGVPTPTASAQSKLGAALAESPASSGASSTDGLSGLQRNSYIIIGLVAGVLVLLLGVMIKLLSNSRSQQYRAVPNIDRPPVHFSDKPYEAETEAFQTPYDDEERRT
ncbi:aspartic peptidase domain-containing protein [Sparassis latifolia]